MEDPKLKLEWQAAKRFWEFSVYVPLQRNCDSTLVPCSPNCVLNDETVRIKHILCQEWTQQAVINTTFCRTVYIPHTTGAFLYHVRDS